ncbi:MAG: hypothetical protein KAJ62_07985 [Desulfobacteraceae bacterium]|nr:hypothetical protein [Desulfobacteraceae bacterium]
MLKSEGKSLQRVVSCTPKHEYASASNLELRGFAKEMGMGGPSCLIMSVERGE